MQKTISMVSAVTLLTTALCLTACRIPDLPDDPIVFSKCTVQNTPDDSYIGIEWDGRTYVMYGALKNGVKYGECLGYIEGDENDRIYTVEECPAEQYLINFYVHGEMEQAVVLRELGTKGSSAPDIADAYGYEIWKAE